MNLTKILQTSILLVVGAWAFYEIKKEYQIAKDDKDYLYRLRRSGL